MPKIFILAFCAGLLSCKPKIPYSENVKIIKKSSFELIKIDTIIKRSDSYTIVSNVYHKTINKKGYISILFRIKDNELVIPISFNRCQSNRKNIIDGCLLDLK